MVVVACVVTTAANARPLHGRQNNVFYTIGIGKAYDTFTTFLVRVTPECIKCAHRTAEAIGMRFRPSRIPCLFDE